MGVTFQVGERVVLIRSIGPGSLPTGSEGVVVHLYCLGDEVYGFEVEFGGEVGCKPVTCDMVKVVKEKRRRVSASQAGLKPWEKALIRAAGRGDEAAFSTLIHHARRNPGFAERASKFWERWRSTGV